MDDDPEITRDKDEFSLRIASTPRLWDCFDGTRTESLASVNTVILPSSWETDWGL